MKIDIINQINGVKVFLSGFSTEELGSKIEACQSVNCGHACDLTIPIKGKKQ